MPLIFKGPPMLTHTKGSVRFTAYCTTTENPQVVGCQVTRGALEYLSKNPNLNGETMLVTFNAHIATIRAAASALYDQGVLEPRVTELVLLG